MRKFTISIIALAFLFASCEKKVKDYKNISLISVEESSILLSEIPGRIRVFTFVSPECPLSENYSKTLLDLQEELLDSDVVFYYVFPGTFYPREQVKQFLKTYKLPFDHSYFDPDYQFRDFCSASITPEAIIIDWAGQIRYSGAIDNWAITLGKQRQVISEHYVKDAISDLLEDNKVKVSKTRAVGCIIE